MKIFLRIIRRNISRILIPIVRIFASFLIWFISLWGKIYTKLWQYADLASYEHRFDYMRGLKNFYWLERGILGMRFLPHGAKVLDLGCGDGIYSGIFYSTRASKVDAVDYDPKIISLAHKYYKRSNVTFRQADIIKMDFLKKEYDAIYLFAVIEHFTIEEGKNLIKNIAGALSEDGFFMGSTPLFSEIGGHNIEHQHEFSTEDELKSFLVPFFDEVEIWVSAWPERNECYFLCRSPKK